MFLISPSSGALEGLCFVMVTFPGYSHILLGITQHVCVDKHFKQEFRSERLMKDSIQFKF